MKSLEPEIQRIIAKGKAEIQKLKALHEVNDTSMEFLFQHAVCFDSKRSLTIYLYLHVLYAIFTYQDIHCVRK